MFKNHPKGLFAASLANMGERFGFYTMSQSSDLTKPTPELSIQSSTRPFICWHW